jgi:hypothetical protein
MGRAGELFAQGLRQVRHLREIRRSLLVNPAKELRGAKALFAEPLAEGGQTVQIVVKKVGRHRSRQPAEPPQASDGPGKG